MGHPAHFKYYGNEMQVNRIVDALWGPTDGENITHLLFGAGTLADPVTWATADLNGIELRTESTATTGDSRSLYISHAFSSTGSGEALRAKGIAGAAGVATGGTANGAHIGFQELAAGTISGQSTALRLTYEVDAATKVVSPNSSVLILETVLGAGITTNANSALIRVVQSATEASTMRNLLQLPVPSAKTTNQLFVARHADCTASHAIRICDTAGTAYWIMVSTDTPGD